MNIIFIGPPASGKGTQASKVADELDYFYLSTGQMFRDMKNERPDIARYLDKGLLVPDDEVIVVLKSYLEQQNRFDGIVLDGTPRSVYQFEKINPWLEKKGEGFGIAVSITISQKEAIKRLSNRRTHKITKKVYNLITDPPGPDIKKEDLYQRKDDNPEVISKRFEEYREQTEPLVKYLEKEGILMKIDGERSIDVIFKDIISRLKEKNVQ